MDDGADRDAVVFICCSFEVANYLNWYLRVEIEDPRHGRMFSRVHDSLMTTLNSCVASRGVAWQSCWRVQRVITSPVSLARPVLQRRSRRGDVEHPVRADGVCAPHQRRWAAGVWLQARSHSNEGSCQLLMLQLALLRPCCGLSLSPLSR